MYATVWTCAARCFPDPLKMASANKRKAVAAAVIVAVLLKRRKREASTSRERRSCNARSWLKIRTQLGAYRALVKELRGKYQDGYYNFLRMNEDSFQELLSLVSPAIEKKDNNMV